MLYRKITRLIKNYLRSDSNKMMVIDGARQVGKSYIIRSIGTSMFPNYIEINMENDRLGDRLFANARTVEDFILVLSTIAGDKLKDKKNTLVFIDEIQAYKHLLTMVKFLMEDGRFTYIASGSQLGIALKTAQSLPLGSMEIHHMYPLDFEEFLIANGVGEYALKSMNESFEREESLSEDLHRKMMDYLKKYLLVGGMPDAVNSYLSEHNMVSIRKIQDDIKVMYKEDAAKYEKESNKKLKIQRIYDMIPSNMENKKKRLVAKDIEDKKGKRMTNYQDEFDYIIAAGIAIEVNAISNPTYPLVENEGKNLLKMYLNDVGILTGVLYRNNIMPVMKDERSVNLGSVYESFVAQELKAHSFKLCYYDNKKNGEVDYLVDDADHMTVMPLEVKSGKDYRIHSALDHFVSNKDYGVKRAIVLSNEREVFVRDKVLYLPIYYTMFLIPSALDKAEYIKI